MQLRTASAAPLIAAGCLACSLTTPANATCFQFGETNPAIAYTRSETSLLSAPAVTRAPGIVGDSNPAVVGLWKFNLATQGTAGMEDGTEIDSGYQAWHSDGTELLNSGGIASMTQSFCAGAWQQLSDRHYVLNHASLSLDPIGSRYVGPGSFTEEIVLDESRNHFAGHFTIVQYSTDQTTVLREVKGVVTGERITEQR